MSGAFTNGVEEFKLISAQESVAWPDCTPEKLAGIRSYAEFCAGSGVPSHPLEVFLEVSNVCDLKCAMCWQFSALNTNRLTQLRTLDRGFLDTANISGNLDSVLRGALLVHCFGFGEPTLHPAFRSIIEQVTRLGCMTDFYTNGMHLDEGFCEFLVESGVCQIIVSFSGATRDIYENIYLGGNFDQVLAGIERLAAAKAARGSNYPVIHINSIGFEDHVARFDEFVELVGARGANVVFLRKLDVHPHMPHLFEHVSILRPEHEGEILARARTVAQRLGVRLDMDLYERHAAADVVDYILQEAELRNAVQDILGRQGRVFGGTKLSQFQEIVRATPLVRDPGVEKKSARVLELDIDSKAAAEALGIGASTGKTDPAGFQCMEPFKTLYITRNGPAKPCCFADADWFLGDAKNRDGVDVWRGAGFEAVRDGLSKGDYPKFCNGCLKNKSAPGHFAGSLVEMYLDWHAAQFGPGLRGELDAGAPGARRAIGDARPLATMAAFRAIAEARPAVHSK